MSQEINHVTMKWQWHTQQSTFPCLWHNVDNDTFITMAPASEIIGPMNLSFGTYISQYVVT